VQGETKVISALNKLLANELAAMDQYFIHSEMYNDWGMNKLYERIAHEFDDEKGHAKKLIERILFLEGRPNLVSREAINIGADVASMLRSDLDIEYSVGALLKETIELCEQEQDFVTRTMLEELLDDTEMDHTLFLEQQLRLIKMIGVENYIQSQL
jgi:bacterioferritin